MVLMKCDSVSPGLRPSQRAAGFKDYRGKQDWILVEEDYLTRQGEAFLLPVGLLQYDETGQLALIELTQESVGGTWRFWVARDILSQPEEAAV